MSATPSSARSCYQQSMNYVEAIGRVRIYGVDVTEQRRATSESLQRLAAIVESSDDAIIGDTLDGTITSWNHGAERMYGYTAGEVVGQPISILVPPDCSNEVPQLLDRIRRGERLEHYETIRIRKDGRPVTVSMTLSPIKDASGQIVGASIIARDITERRRAEQELNQYREHLEELVAQRTDELARSNKDLEQFAYVASHDLQEPLRMVAGYLELLRDRYQGRLDDKADKYIGYAVDGAERMSVLIRDLLAYSRVNTRGEQLQPVNAQEALDFALRNLRSAVEDSKATITHDPLPVVRADRTQLAQVFQNLVGNAIKFRCPDRPPRIHISAGQDHGQRLFAVQDNGIGFKEEYKEKLFLIFQRLHSRGKYPGTGIGLAICKRIVERHGGRIWAAGEPDKGSIFYFTIPM